MTHAPLAGHELPSSAVRNLPLPAVLAMTGISKGHVYFLIAQGKFPKPVKVGKRSFWFGPAVEQWIRDLHQRSADGEAA